MLKMKFSFQEYLRGTYKIYQAFEVLISKENKYRCEIFKDMEISPSSYRFVRNRDSAGRELIAKIEKHLGILPLKIFRVRDYEDVLSEMYADIYYRKVLKIKEYESILNVFMDESTIMFTVFKLFRIFLNLMDTSMPPTENKERNKKLFDEIKIYYKFLTDEMKVIFLIVNCLLGDSVDNLSDLKVLSERVPHLMGMMYYVLISKYILEQDYVKVLEYSKMCEVELIKDYNFKRLWFMHMNQSVSLNALKKYQKANDLCQKAIISMQAFNYNFENGIYESIVNNYYISLVGLKNYAKVLHIIMTKDDYTPFEYLIMILVNYCKGNNHLIEDYYKELKRKLDDQSPYHKISEAIFEIINGININENLSKLNNIFYAGYVEILKEKMR